MFFKAYVPTKNKKCLMSFKGKSASELLTLDEARKYDEYAGILAEDAILIDIDDYDHEGNLKHGKAFSEILMKMVEELEIKCRVYKANRGYHFVFKNRDVKKCFTDTYLTCGLRADIKVGSNNSYEILKYKGEERKIIYDKFDDEEYDYLPKWLYPIKTSYDFVSMGDGDGRNQALFNYILTLQGEGFSVSECREVLTVLNKYILAKPLDERELSVIMRNEAFKKEIFFADKTFLFDKFSKYLMSNAYIRKINDKLHIYKDGIYVDGSLYIEQEMIKNIEHLNRAKRAEVLAYLDLIVPAIEPSDARFVAFNNGIYDIVDDTMIPFSPDIVITNKIPYDYIPHSYHELADTTLNKLACHDKDIRALLEEVIGYCFYRRNELRKSFILIGDKANGKSTYLDLVGNLLGGANTSALDLKDIGDRFRTAELFNKLANIGDDIEDEFISNAALFKKVVSGSEITVEKKGKDPHKFHPFTKFLFSANNIPRIKDKTGAVLDRLVIIPFNATFSPTDPDFDPYIKYKLLCTEVMEYLICIGLEGLKRVLARRAFTISDKIKAELNAYEKKNNPVLLFFDEITIDDVIGRTNADIYTRYDVWSQVNGFQKNSIVEFGRKITKHFDLTTQVKKIDGKTQRVYIKK